MISFTRDQRTRQVAHGTWQDSASNIGKVDQSRIALAMFGLTLLEYDPAQKQAGPDRDR